MDDHPFKDAKDLQSLASMLAPQYREIAAVGGAKVTKGIENCFGVEPAVACRFQQQFTSMVYQ